MSDRINFRKYKIRNRRFDYIRHALFGNRSGKTVNTALLSLGVVALMLTSFAFAYAQPSEQPPGGNIIPTFSAVKISDGGEDLEIKRGTNKIQIVPESGTNVEIFQDGSNNSLDNKLSFTENTGFGLSGGNGSIWAATLLHMYGGGSFISITNNGTEFDAGGFLNLHSDNDLTIQSDRIHLTSNEDGQPPYNSILIDDNYIYIDGELRTDGLAPVEFNDAVQVNNDLTVEDDLIVEDKIMIDGRGFIEIRNYPVVSNRSRNFSYERNYFGTCPDEPNHHGRVMSCSYIHTGYWHPDDDDYIITRQLDNMRGCEFDVDLPDRNVNASTNVYGRIACFYGGDYNFQN